MTSPQANILVVEDDPSTRILLQDLLTASGYKVTNAETVAAALTAIYEHPFELVLLETVVGNDNGMRIAHAIRQQGKYTAIIILTKHATLETAIQAIDLDVQAYLLKPQDPTRLIHTIAKHIRHLQEQRRCDWLLNEVRSAVHYLDRNDQTEHPVCKAPYGIVSGQLQLNRSTFEARFGGCALHLTTAEFDLLWALVEADGHLLQSEQLVKAAFGYTASAQEAKTLIKPHISHLRYKLEPDPEHPSHIITVRSKGYLWRP